MTDFDRKILDNFPGKVVRKDLTTLMKKGANVPTYVLEYLLGRQWPFLLKYLSRHLLLLLHRMFELT